MDKYGGYYYNTHNNNNNNNNVRMSHLPTFGSWDYTDGGLPFTECFETARQQHQPAAGSGYGAAAPTYSREEVMMRDLYVAGDLYRNDVVTPAVIVVPRRQKTKGGGGPPPPPQVNKKQQWSGSSEYGINQAPRRRSTAAAAVTTAKPVDEDLYKIPSHLLRAPNPKKTTTRKKKVGWGLFSSCLLPP